MRETRFKDTEIGKIPEEWKMISLGDIGDVRMCKRVMKYQTSDKGVIPFYKIGTFGKQADAYISRELYNSYKAKYHYPRKGDILLSAAGTIGRTVIFNGQPSYFQDSNIVWIENPENIVSNELLYYIYKDLKWVTESGTIPRIYNSIVRSIKFCVPIDKAEQSRIASALTSIDNLISSLDKLIEKKKNIKQGTMQQLLTGKKRLKGFTAPWEEQKLIDSFSIIGNNTYSRDELSDSGTVRDVHYGDVLIKYGSVIDAASAALPFIKGKETVSHPLMEGDIIMADTAEDETCGKVCEIRGVGNSFIEAGLHTIVLRPNCPYGPCFLGYYMNSSAFHDMLLPLMQGTKVTSISKTALMNVQMVIPPSITEQSEIAKVLVSMDNDITALVSKKAKYESIKQGMMQQLLSGRIRLII